jgi:hypothetical protein
MTTTLSIATRNCVGSFLVWELFRIPYNLALLIAIFVGAQVLYVNMPLFYIQAVLLFNALYFLLPCLDFLFKATSRGDKSWTVYSVYLALSVSLVIFGPIVRLLSML